MASNTAPVATSGEPAQPRKRGRKPGPLSRSAREAQRKLNHSIIEKARRTKINEALAALRQLVPSDYTRRPHNRDLVKDPDSEDELDEDEEDEDGEYGALQRKAAAPANRAGTKKREEKEFKLEVLERTVGYLQDLNKRYDELRERHEQLVNSRPCRCSGYQAASNVQPTNRKRSLSNAETANPAGNGVVDPSSGERPSKRHEPLPPISSWLPLSPPSLSRSPTNPLSPISRPGALTPISPSHLPTPPSSSAPFQPSHVPISPLNTFNSPKGVYIPSISLGPTVLPLSTSTNDKGRHPSVSLSPSIPTTCIRSSSKGVTRPSQYADGPPHSPRTPEDETAASLLLTMRLQHSPTSPGHRPTTSPLIRGTMPTSPVRPIRSSSSGSGRTGTSSPPSSLFLPPPQLLRHTASGHTAPGSEGRDLFVKRRQNHAEHEVVRSVVVETPGSLLGLTGHRSRNGF